MEHVKKYDTAYELFTSSPLRSLDWISQLQKQVNPLFGVVDSLGFLDATKYSSTIYEMFRKQNSSFFAMQEMNENLKRLGKTSSLGYKPYIINLSSPDFLNQIKGFQDRNLILEFAEEEECSIDDLEVTKYSLDDEDNCESAVQIIRRIRPLIHSIYSDNSRIFDIRDREFEEVLAELLIAKGFDVELTKQTRDGGRDIIALKSFEDMPMKMLVECKKWGASRPVGVDTIRSFMYVVEKEKANLGMIATTSYFSPDSMKEREFNGHRLHFKNNSKVIRMIKDYCIS